MAHPADPLTGIDVVQERTTIVRERAPDGDSGPTYLQGRLLSTHEVGIDIHAPLGPQLRRQLLDQHCPWGEVRLQIQQKKSDLVWHSRSILLHPLLEHTQAYTIHRLGDQFQLPRGDRLRWVPASQTLWQSPNDRRPPPPWPFSVPPYRRQPCAGPHRDGTDFRFSVMWRYEWFELVFSPKDGLDLGSFLEEALSDMFEQDPPATIAIWVNHVGFLPDIFGGDPQHTPAALGLHYWDYLHVVPAKCRERDDLTVLPPSAELNFTRGHPPINCTGLYFPADPERPLSRKCEIFSEDCASVAPSSSEDSDGPTGGPPPPPQPPSGAQDTAASSSSLHPDGASDDASPERHRPQSDSDASSGQPQPRQSIRRHAVQRRPETIDLVDTTSSDDSSTGAPPSQAPTIRSANPGRRNMQATAAPAPSAAAAQAPLPAAPPPAARRRRAASAPVPRHRRILTAPPPRASLPPPGTVDGDRKPAAKPAATIPRVDTAAPRHNLILSAPPPDTPPPAAPPRASLPPPGTDDGDRKPAATTSHDTAPSPPPERTPPPAAPSRASLPAPGTEANPAAGSAVELLERADPPEDVGQAMDATEPELSRPPSEKKEKKKKNKKQKRRKVETPKPEERPKLEPEGRK